MLSMASLTLFGHQLNMPANPGLISWGFSFLGSWGLYACNYVELNFVFLKKNQGQKKTMIKLALTKLTMIPTRRATTTAMNEK